MCCTCLKIRQKNCADRFPISLSPSKTARQFSRVDTNSTSAVREASQPHQRSLNAEWAFNRFRALSQAEPNADQRPLNLANAAAIAVSGLGSPFCFCFSC